MTLTPIRIRVVLTLFIFSILSAAPPFLLADPTIHPSDTTLRVLTYNLLHHSDSFIHHVKSLVLSQPLPSDRIAPTLELLEHQQADVIALQEVTPTFMEELQKAPWLSDYHIESTLPPVATGWRRYLSKAIAFILGYQPWGQAILSKWPITEVHSYPLYGRPLLVTTLDIEGFELTVATCHLDSFREEIKKRINQLDQAFNILGSSWHAILLGDFNFGENATENAALHSTYIDVWQELNPDEPGYTYDTKANSLLVKKVAPGKPSQRIDRILVKSTVLDPQRAVLIGTEIIMYKNTPMHLSDHFGVLVDLQIDNNKTGIH